MWPHWEEYKKRVEARRKENQFYWELGKAVIRIVEESCMQEEADMMIAKEMEIEPDDWDFNFEDVLGSRKHFSDVVFTMFLVAMGYG